MTNRKTFQLRFVATGLVVAMLGAFAATTANAQVQRVYAGQLRFGFGDGGITGMGSTGTTGNLQLDLTPMSTMTEMIDTANNAIPPCAAPGAKRVV